MSKEIVNITDMLVRQEIEKAISPEESPTRSNLQKRGISAVEQEIASFVCKQVPPKYVVIETGDRQTASHQAEEGFCDLRSQISDSIDRAFEAISQHQTAAIDPPSSLVDAKQSEPSHWFG